jgi:hypothetical protein
MRVRTSILLALIFAELSCYAQNGSNAAQDALATSPVASSPLNGNWNITGNRKKEQFPLLSLFLQVDGAQIFASGDIEVRCPNDPRNGAGAEGGSVRGEIAAGGSFVLGNGNTKSTTQWEIRGRVPAEGAASWDGEYTVGRKATPNCPAFQLRNSFTATQLPALDATFSGSLAMKYFKPPPPDYQGPQSAEEKITVTVTQGSVVPHTLKNGSAYFYLPLAGTIEVKGSECFSHGAADPVTYSTHGSVPSPRSTLQGDFVTLRFTMDDESELDLRANFAEPGESALLVVNSTVRGGKCQDQTFYGTLERRR